MKLISALALMSFTLAIPASAPAQIVNIWGKVDTVTAGEFDDLNPSIAHNVYASSPGGFIWLVFERHTSAESQIAARKFNRASGTWDSAVVVLSSRLPAEEQRNPDYSDMSYYNAGTGSRVMRLAAWQVRKDHRWQIYYSTLNDSASSWSAPSLLVSDSLDNTGVQIRPILDSAVIITWKRANTVMGLVKTISTGTPAETLAVSSSDSLEYDVSSRYGVTGVIWTSSVQGKMTPLYRTLSRYSLLQFSVPETVQVASPCFTPHLAISQTPDPTFLFETQGSGRRDAVYFINFAAPYGSLSGDPFSDNRNARSFNFPIITKQAGSVQNWIPSFLGLVVYEKYRGLDSSLVFVYGAEGDTVRTPGHNWNALVSSQPFSAQSGQSVLVVWESNRSGRAHIYCRTVPLFIGAISHDPPVPLAYQLLQNYPNPFNPSTTIRYALPSRAHVRLCVFNTLGQQVAVLQNGETDAGYHEVKFDGTNFATGVYFYSLQAGGFVQTRKLILIK